MKFVNELVALRSGSEDLVDIFELKYSSRIKQECLLFDQIGILRLGVIIHALETVGTDVWKKKMSHSLTDLKWLIENGILFEPVLPPNSFESLLTMCGQHHAVKYREADSEIKKLTQRGKKTDLARQELIDIFTAMLRQDSIVLRLI